MYSDYSLLPNRVSAQRVVEQFWDENADLIFSQSDEKQNKKGKKNTEKPTIISF